MDIIVFLGPPGAGKGTLSQLCKKKLGWKQLSTGNLCRKHISKGTSIGKEIDFAIKSGKLISDSLISQMVNDWFSEENGFKGVILDGYPRTVPQAQALHEFIQTKNKKLRLSIIKLFISDEQIVERLGTRFICQNNDCQQVYSLNDSSLAPRSHMICDQCKTLLGRRKDDEELIVRERLHNYHQHEQTLIDFYQTKGFIVSELNVEQSLDKVFIHFSTLMGLKTA